MAVSWLPISGRNGNQVTAGSLTPDNQEDRHPNGVTAFRHAPSGQRVTLPALRQPVQTLRRFGVPFTVARTRWMLGLKRRLVILRDHGRLLPKAGFFAQMSQTAATVTPTVGTAIKSGVALV